MSSMIRTLLATAAAVAVGVQGAAVPEPTLKVSTEPVPLRLVDTTKCIVKADPQPKKSPFEVTLQWGACGQDDANAMLFKWDGKCLAISTPYHYCCGCITIQSHIIVCFMVAPPAQANKPRPLACESEN